MILSNYYGNTQSLCPVCLRRIPAQKVRRDDAVYMEKSCPEHGCFQTVLWRGIPDYMEWGAGALDSENHDGCPYSCGICPDHAQSTCCVLLEITENCELRCPVCFASSSGGKEPSVDEIGGWYDMLMDRGGPYNIQLSGGEPATRDDIPQIIRLGLQKGMTFFQLNTNGLRLADDLGFARELKDAGLGCVFLQFDGLSDKPYMTLRGQSLLHRKIKAVDNCSRAGLGVVLVPTLAPGVNTDEIGPILEFAVERMPDVRGVHFQPLAWFGRYPPGLNDRITIPELLREIERQTGGKLKAGDFQPGVAEHAYCSFNGSFLLEPDGSLKPLNKSGGSCCECTSDRARVFVARHWSAPEKTVSRNEAPQSLDEFSARLSQYTLTVSGMAFQDAWNIDLNRLKKCHIHIVSPDSRLVPFCAYNVTAIDGKTLYRNKTAGACMKTAGLIAAAGLSSRMGSFKPLLTLGGETMIRRIASTLLSSGADCVIIVTGHMGETIERNVSDLGVICIKNPDYEKTQMLDSVKLGLHYLMDKCDRVLFTPVDIPLFSKETVLSLLESGGKLACPHKNGKDGHPILIDSEFIPEILTYSGPEGLRGAVKSLNQPMTRINTEDSGAFLDADTPEDFEKLIELVECPSNSAAIRASL